MRHNILTMKIQDTKVGDIIQLLDSATGDYNSEGPFYLITKVQDRAHVIRAYKSRSKECVYIEPSRKCRPVDYNSSQVPYLPKSTVNI